MTNAELAVLSLVGEQPRHGYEIEQVIDQRGMRDWTEIGFSSIYFLLNKLEKRGLIRSHIEPAARKGPARKVYQCTPSGIEKLHHEVRFFLSQPVPVDSPLQLALANLPVLQPREIVEALRNRRQILSARKEEINQKWQSQLPLPYFVDAMFDNSMRMIQAELAWVEKFIQRVEEENAKA